MPEQTLIQAAPPAEQALNTAEQALNRDAHAPTLQPSTAGAESSPAAPTLPSIPEKHTTPSRSAPSEGSRKDTAVIARAAIFHLQGELRQALDTLNAVDKADESADLLMARGYLQVELKLYEPALETFARVVIMQPDSPEALFQQGLSLHKLSRIAEALPLFEKAAHLRPDWIEVPLARSICHLGLKQYIAAMEQADLCLALDPQYAQALSVKAVALHLTWEPDRAASLYHQVLSQNPRCVQTLMNLVTLSLQQKKYDEVRHWSSELLTVQQDNTLALEGMAVAAFYRNDFENARRYYERLTQLMPDHAEHWLNLGTSLQKQARVAESAEAYARAVRVRPDSLNAHVYLGSALWKAGDLAGASNAYQAALLKWPEREEIALSLSQVLEAMLQTANAEAVCAKFCERVSGKPLAWFRLGYLQWKRGAAEAAAESFERATSLQANWTEAEINLALALQATGKLERSEELLNAILKREPSNASALRALATLALIQSNPERALALHLKLIELGDANEDVYFNCGVLAQGLNKPEDAIKFYREAINRRKDFAEAMLNLGHVLNTLGQTAEAKNYWVPALELKPEFVLTYFRRGLEPASKVN
jgi:tetratricopeptide (TPR) repeat protein